MEISGLEDVAGRRESHHKGRLCVSRKELETTEKRSDETVLASEMAETISSQVSEATMQFAENQKATKLTETKLQRTFHAGTR